MNGFSEIFPVGGNLYSKLSLFDLYSTAFQMKGPLGDKLVTGIVLASISDGEVSSSKVVDTKWRGCDRGFPASTRYSITVPRHFFYTI